MAKADFGVCVIILPSSSLVLAEIVLGLNIFFIGSQFGAFSIHTLGENRPWVQAGLPVANQCCRTQDSQMRAPVIELLARAIQTDVGTGRPSEVN